MFKVNPNGFSIEFSNGNTVSVQWGEGNYCENKRNGSPDGRSRDAEVIAWDAQGNFIMEAAGWQSPEEVATLIDKISKL